jgi:hypothetical protein
MLLWSVVLILTTSVPKRWTSAVVFVVVENSKSTFIILNKIYVSHKKSNNFLKASKWTSERTVWKKEKTWYGSWIYNYPCNPCLSPLTLWFDTTLCDKVCQWLATGQWFSPVYSTNKTDYHDITERVLKWR